MTEGSRPSYGSRIPRIVAGVLALGIAGSGMVGEADGAPAPRGSSAALPKVYLVPVVSSTPDVSPLIPKRFNKQFVQELQARQAIETLTQLGDVKKKSGAGPGGSATARLTTAEQAPDRRAEAKSFAKKAKTALRRRKYAQAIQLCLKSIRAFDASKVYLQHTDHLARVFAVLAQALLLSRKTATGVRAVETAMGYDPALRISVRSMPKRIRAAFFKAARGILKKPKATVSVVAHPKDATIHIDGDEKGVGKANVSNIVPGRHYVVVRKPGFVSFGQIVQLAPGGMISVKAKLDPVFKVKGSGSLARLFQKELTKRLKTHLVDVRVKPLAEQLAKRVKSNFVVLAAVERASGGGYMMRTYLYRVSDKKLVELQAASFDVELLNLTKGIYNSAQEVLTAIDQFPADRDITRILLRKGVRHGGGPGATGLVKVTDAGKKRQEVEIKVPLYKKWWFWVTLTAVLVTVGGAVTGGYFGYQATHQEATGYRVNIDLP